MKLIDIQSYNNCNRRCPFCPPYKNGNKHIVEYLDYESMIKIAEYINKYRDKDFIRICFNRYFEPLLDIDYVLYCKKIISDSLESLENIDFTIHTNGELLNKKNIYKLTNNFNSVVINLYEKSLSVSYEFIANIIGDYNINIDYENNKMFYNNIIINYEKNQNIKLKSRGGIIEINDENIKLNTDCSIYKDMIAIESNGDIMPCCELYSRNSEHMQYKIGNIKKDDIDIIHNLKYNFNIKNEACAKCNAKYEDVIM